MSSDKARESNSVTRLIASLRLRQLQIISTLGDTGNMRAAAQRLNMTTSAVSKSLHEAEELFGTPIFRRLPRGLATTFAGDLVIQRARLLLAEIALLSDELSTARQGSGGTLVIGAPPFIAWSWVPKLLAALAPQHRPSTRIVEGRLADMTKRFDSGDVDILVTMDSPSELGDLKPDGYALEPVGLDRWLIVGRPEHPALRLPREKGGISLDDLRSVDWILPPRPTNARRMIEDLARTAKLSPIVPRYESLNAATNLRLAAEGLGLTVVSDHAAQELIESGRLVSLPVTPAPPALPIVLVYRLTDARHTGVSAIRSAAQRVYSEAASRS